MLLYLQQNVKKNDADWIACTLSFMKKGIAAEWARDEVDRILVDQTTRIPLADPKWGKFIDFWQKCIARFGNPNRKTEAHMKVMQLRQGSRSVVEYFQQLDQFVVQAGYTGDQFDNFLIERV